MPCRRSAPAQGLLEAVGWCLEISPGKESDALLAAHSDSLLQLKRWKDKPEILPQLFGFSVSLQSSQNLAHSTLNTSPQVIGETLAFSIWVCMCAITSNTHVLFLYQQFPFGPIWKTSWVIRGWIFLLSISNSAFWQEKNVKSHLEKKGIARRRFNYFINKVPKCKEKNPGNTNILHIYIISQADIKVLTYHNYTLFHLLEHSHNKNFTRDSFVKPFLHKSFHLLLQQDLIFMQYIHSWNIGEITLNWRFQIRHLGLELNT